VDDVKNIINLKKSNEEVCKKAGVQRRPLKKERQWQFAFLGHVLKRHGFENLVVTGKMERSKARKRHRMFTRSSKRPANFQQTSSISTCILNTFAGSLLNVCWIL